MSTITASLTYDAITRQTQILLEATAREQALLKAALKKQGGDARSLRLHHARAVGILMTWQQLTQLMNLPEAEDALAAHDERRLLDLVDGLLQEDE